MNGGVCRIITHMPLVAGATSLEIDRTEPITRPMPLSVPVHPLEAEPGEDIPKAIAEAQRRYVIETLALKEFEQSPEYLRRQFAMRGLGT